MASNGIRERHQQALLHSSQISVLPCRASAAEPAPISRFKQAGCKDLERCAVGVRKSAPPPLPPDMEDTLDILGQLPDGAMDSARYFDLGPALNLELPANYPVVGLAPALQAANNPFSPQLVSPAFSCAANVRGCMGEAFIMQVDNDPPSMHQHTIGSFCGNLAHLRTHYDTASLELEPPLGALPLGQPAGGPTSSITSNGTPIHHRLFSGPDSLPAACEPLARAGRVVELPAVPEPGQAQRTNSPQAIEAHPAESPALDLDDQGVGISTTLADALIYTSDEGGDASEAESEATPAQQVAKRRAPASASDSDYHPFAERGSAVQAPRRSTCTHRASAANRAGKATLQGGRAGKKRGRPIAYRGDPQAAGLSEDEVRRIRRRVANRESARRVRQKRQELMEEQQAQIGSMQVQNKRLVADCTSLERDKASLIAQVKEFQDKAANADLDNAGLRGEITTLRQSLEVNLRLMQRASQVGMGLRQPAAGRHLHMHEPQQGGAEGMRAAQALHTFYSPFECSGPFDYDAEGSSAHMWT